MDIDSTKRVKRIGLAALILSAGIFCSRLLGYVREAVIAYMAGAGTQTDAYNAAFMLPDLMNYFLAGGTFSITFIPLFAGYISKKEPEKAQRLFSLIATTMGMLLAAGIIICEIFANPLARLLFPGFNAEQITETVRMTRVILPGQFFHYIGGLMMAVLMAHGKFVPSAIAPLIYNFFIIVCGIVLSPHLGMMGFAIGALAGAVLGPFLLPALCLRKTVQYRPVFGFGDEDFKRYILLTLPLMLGVSLTTVDEWLGRILGSTMAAGSISCLNYARRLVLVPIAIVGQAAGQAALPYLSQLSAQGDYKGAAGTLHKTLNNTILLSMILIGFFLILSEPMTAIVFERGEFTSENTQTTSMLLRILSISIVFWTIQMVAVRGFYAAQNTFRPMIVTTGATLLSIPVYYIFTKLYGLPGVAISSCAGMFIQSSSIVYFYHRSNVHFHPTVIIKAFIKGIFLCASSSFGCWLGLMLAHQLPISSPTWKILFELGFGGMFGVIFAGTLSRLIIPEQFKGFTDKVMRRIRRRNVQ